MPGRLDSLLHLYLWLINYFSFLQAGHCSILLQKQNLKLQSSDFKDHANSHCARNMVRRGSFQGAASVHSSRLILEFKFLSFLLVLRAWHQLSSSFHLPHGSLPNILSVPRTWGQTKRWRSETDKTDWWCLLSRDPRGSSLPRTWYSMPPLLAGVCYCILWRFSGPQAT